MPRFSIHPAALAAFPELQVHAVRCRTAGAIAAALQPAALLAHAVAEITSQARDHEALVKSWREAYARMGATPSRYQSSIESLLRRVAKGNPIATGIPLVDLYNAHSLRARAPVGAYDIARLPPEPMELRPCRPDHDQFHPLGAPADRYPLLPRLLLYASGSEILCWGLNHRDSRHTALTAESQDVAFFSEAAFAGQHAACTTAIAAIREQLQQAGGVCSAHLVAHADAPGFDL